MIQVKSPKDVPNVKHYAVILYDKVSVYDGYSDYNNELCPKHYVTEDEIAWKNFITECSIKKSWQTEIPFVALVVESKAVITTKVVVEVK